jgi:predicted nucleic acid-binding protein
MLITAHALCVSAVLVTNDQAFGQMAHLPVEDCTE